MTVHLPRIGVTNCIRAKALLEEYPHNIVGSFWIMCRYGFSTEDIPYWWSDLVLKENPAKAIIDAFKQGAFDGEHNNPLYLGFCIIVVADPSNPIHLSYLIEHLRMWACEGIALLKIMAEFNIPAHTEVTYPEGFLNDRYGYNNESDTYNHLCESLSHWSVQTWEDYCSYLMSEHGQRMFYSYCKKINLTKDSVKATVEKGSKYLVLTEGETDPIYIRTALDLLGRQEILEQVDIEWVGLSVDKGKSINTGDSGLNNTRDVLLSNPKFLTRKVLLLYDCDTKKQSTDSEVLNDRKKLEKHASNLIN
jgi:hypothetical protein